MSKIIHEQLRPFGCELKSRGNSCENNSWTFFKLAHLSKNHRKRLAVEKNLVSLWYNIIT